MKTLNGLAGSLRGSDHQVWARITEATQEGAWLSGKLTPLNIPGAFLTQLREYSECIDSGVLSVLDELSTQLLAFGPFFQFENRYETFPISDFYLDGDTLSFKLEPPRNVPKIPIA